MERIKRIGGKLYEFTPRATDTLTAQWLFQQASDAESNRQPDKALELYHKALGYDPTLAMAWINIGTIHFHWRDFVVAEECYRKAIAIDPKCAMAQFDLGNVLEERGRFQEAVEHYREAIALDPRYPDAHYNIALIYTSIGEQRKAIQHFRFYLRCRNASDEVYANEAQHRIRQLARKVGMGIVRKDPISITAVPRKPSVIIEQ